MKITITGEITHLSGLYDMLSAKVVGTTPMVVPAPEGACDKDGKPYDRNAEIAVDRPIELTFHAAKNADTLREIHIGTKINVTIETA